MKCERAFDASFRAAVQDFFARVPGYTHIASLDVVPRSEKVLRAIKCLDFARTHGDPSWGGCAFAGKAGARRCRMRALLAFAQGQTRNPSST
jgi:hypothetical protein